MQQKRLRVMTTIRERADGLSNENVLESDFNPYFQQPGMVVTVSEMVIGILPAGRYTALDLLTERVRYVGAH